MKNRLGVPFRISLLGIMAAGVVALGGCSPEIGSDAWCEKLSETPKVDWSTRDATAYAKNCIFK